MPPLIKQAMTAESAPQKKAENHRWAEVLFGHGDEKNRKDFEDKLRKPGFFSVLGHSMATIGHRDDACGNRLQQLGQTRQ